MRYPVIVTLLLLSRIVLSPCTHPVALSSVSVISETAQFLQQRQVIQTCLQLAVWTLDGLRYVDTNRESSEIRMMGRNVMACHSERPHSRAC